MQINTDKRFPFDGLVLGTFERSIYHSSSIGDYPVYEIRGDELGEKSSEIFSIPRSLLRG
jgi:hypothetical protein